MFDITGDLIFNIHFGEVYLNMNSVVISGTPFFLSYGAVASNE